MFDPPTIATTSSQASGSSTGNSRRKRLEPDATRRIVVASFSNETDALEILAKAATDADEPEDRSDDAPQISKHVSWADDAPRALAQFPLVARGILDETTLERLVDVFFKQHHPVLVSQLL
jgi:hypothetical protein